MGSCTLDDCPMGKGDLCCYDCDDLQQCLTEWKKACDEVKENIPQSKCDFYNTLSETVKGGEDGEKK